MCKLEEGKAVESQMFLTGARLMPVNKPEGMRLVTSSFIFFPLVAHIADFGVILALE